MPVWVNVAVLVVLLAVLIVAVAHLARVAAHDTACLVAAAYWAGRGDTDRARRILRDDPKGDA